MKKLLFLLALTAALLTLSMLSFTGVSTFLYVNF